MRGFHVLLLLEREQGESLPVCLEESEWNTLAQDYTSLTTVIPYMKKAQSSYSYIYKKGCLSFVSFLLTVTDNNIYPHTGRSSVLIRYADYIKVGASRGCFRSFSFPRGGEGRKAGKKRGTSWGLV